MKKFCNIFIILTILSVFGCNTTKSSVISEDDLDNIIEMLCLNIKGSIPDYSILAVLNFSSVSDKLSSYFIEEIVNCLTNFHNFRIVERQNIQVIQNEMDFQLSGNVSDDSMKSIGKMLVAEYVITGSADDIGENYRIRIFALNVESGERIVSSTFTLRKPNNQIDFFLNDNVTSSIEGTWKAVARIVDGKIDDDLTYLHDINGELKLIFEKNLFTIYWDNDIYKKGIYEFNGVEGILNIIVSWDTFVENYSRKIKFFIKEGKLYYTENNGETFMMFVKII